MGWLRNILSPAGSDCPDFGHGAWVRHKKKPNQSKSPFNMEYAAAYWKNDAMQQGFDIPGMNPQMTEEAQEAAAAQASAGPGGPAPQQADTLSMPGGQGLDPFQQLQQARNQNNMMPMQMMGMGIPGMQGMMG